LSAQSALPGLAIVAMLVSGGGSAQAPVEQVIAELIGLGLLLAPALGVRWRGLYDQDRVFAWLAIALAGLMLAQLVPLPAAVWSGWPGRALFAQGDMLMAGHVLPRAWSIEPDETVAALVFLIPALAIGLRVRLSDRFFDQWVLVWLVFLGLSLLVALAQVSAPPGDWHLYANSHANLPTGLFANRNHQAIAMASGIPLSAGLARAWYSREAGHPGMVPPAIVFAGVAVAGVVGALLTGSRTGCALLVPALVAGLMIWFKGRIDPRQTRWIVLASLAGLVVVIVAGLAVATASPGGALGLVLSRSYTADDDRYRFWPGIVRMIVKYAPWGTGFGSFRRMYEVDEPADLLSPLYLNHAHNDWLEFTLEAGVAGVVLAAGFLVWLMARWLPAWRGIAADPRRQAAGTVIMLVLAHSCFDYPFRTVAMSACCAACAALLSRPAARADRDLAQEGLADG
jgi:O-antigen ligase